MIKTTFTVLALVTTLAILGSCQKKEVVKQRTHETYYQDDGSDDRRDNRAGTRGGVGRRR